MNIALTLALVASSQIKTLFAQTPAKINYDDIIETSDKRCKLVMNFMDDGKFDEGLLDIAREMYRTHCEAMFAKRYIQESKAVSTDGVIEKIRRSAKDISDTCSIDTDVFIGYLNVVGKALDGFFSGLYGEEYNDLTSDIHMNMDAIDDMTNNEIKFLNMRFVFPPFYTDVRALYDELNAEHKENMEVDGNKASEIISRWMEQKINMPPTREVDQSKVLRALSTLFDVDKTPLRQSVIYILLYNMFSDDVITAREDCKKLNAA
ncbi:methionyl-tRNA synthetase, putative [Babesia ovis]|uniref:Methionyl-tRNA synthetase, putative n=1 Tax=Babesia ovis TaxID=5869 RepID=A0A9W5WTB0_BABOV|nr:methionyl-tRNA synthetase, putative [Babesia ovis]